MLCFEMNDIHYLQAFHESLCIESSKLPRSSGLLHLDDFAYTPSSLQRAS